MVLQMFKYIFIWFSFIVHNADIKATS